MNDIDTARLIAYHDAVCFPGCGDDISTYPIPPDEWEPPVTAIEKHGCEHCFAAVYHPAATEAQSGVCEDCRAHALRRAYEEWRAFEDQHTDVLDQT